MYLKTDVIPSSGVSAFTVLLLCIFKSAEVQFQGISTVNKPGVRWRKRNLFFEQVLLPKKKVGGEGAYNKLTMSNVQNGANVSIQTLLLEKYHTNTYGLTFNRWRRKINKSHATEEK